MNFLETSLICKSRNSYLIYVISHAYQDVLGSILATPVFFFLYRTIVLLVRLG